MDVKILIQPLGPSKGIWYCAKGSDDNEWENALLITTVYTWDQHWDTVHYTMEEPKQSWDVNKRNWNLEVFIQLKQNRLHRPKL